LGKLKEKERRKGGIKMKKKNNNFQNLLMIFFFFLIIEVIMDIIFLPADEVLIPADVIFDALLFTVLLLTYSSPTKKEVK
jgi:hypothetical protein